MSFKPSISRWMAATVGAVVLTGVLAACGAPVTTTQDVAGARSDQATGTPPALAGSPSVPTPVTGAVQNLYNVKSFYGQVNITANTNALGSATTGGTSTPTSAAPSSSTNQISVTIDQWYLQPDNMKLQVKNASNSSWINSQLVYDGKTLSYYNAADNQVIQIQDRAQLVLFLNLPRVQLLPQLQLYQLQQTLQNLSSNAQVSRGGSATVAGRSTTMETIIPQGASNIQSIKVWRDDQTGVPLKVQVTDSGGNTVLSLEYTTFDPNANVSSSDFNFSPPNGATVVQPTPDNIAKFAGFSSTTLQDAQSSAGFQLYQVTSLPSGISQQSVQSASVDNSKVVAILYGSGSNSISTGLIEKPSNLRLPFIRGGQRVSAGGIDYSVYQDNNMVVIDWTQGSTALTLATTESPNQAVTMAQSIQPVGAPSGVTPGASPTAATPGVAPAVPVTTPSAALTAAPAASPSASPAATSLPGLTPTAATASPMVAATPTTAASPMVAATPTTAASPMVAATPTTAASPVMAATSTPVMPAMPTPTTPSGAGPGPAPSPTP